MGFFFDIRRRTNGTSVHFYETTFVSHRGREFDTERIRDRAPVPIRPQASRRSASTNRRRRAAPARARTPRRALPGSRPPPPPPPRAEPVSARADSRDAPMQVAPTPARLRRRRSPGPSRDRGRRARDARAARATPRRLGPRRSQAPRRPRRGGDARGSRRLRVGRRRGRRDQRPRRHRLRPRPRAPPMAQHVFQLGDAAAAAADEIPPAEGGGRTHPDFLEIILEVRARATRRARRATRPRGEAAPAHPPRRGDDEEGWRNTSSGHDTVTRTLTSETSRREGKLAIIIVCFQLSPLAADLASPTNPSRTPPRAPDDRRRARISERAVLVRVRDPLPDAPRQGCAFPLTRSRWRGASRCRRSSRA